MTNVSTPIPTALPFSPIVVANGFAFTAGHAALGPEGVIHEGDAYQQSVYTLQHIKGLLEQVGSGLNMIVSANAWVTDIAHAAGLNKAWSEVFTDHKPARATVISDLLVPGLLVEIQVTAAIDEVTA